MEEKKNGLGSKGLHLSLGGIFRLSELAPPLLAVGCAAGLVRSALAETWTLTQDCGRYEWGTATLNQKYWTDSSGAAGEDTSPLASGDDYRFSKVLRLSPADDYAFPGASLTMLHGGTMSWSQSKPVTCGNLIAEGGTLEVYTYLSDGPANSGYNYSYLTLKGKMTVLATADAPLRCVSQYNCTGARIYAALHGSQDAAIAIGGIGSKFRKNSLWTFDDTASYMGEIRVFGTDEDLADYPTSTGYGPWYHYGLRLSATEMPGAVRIGGRNAVLYLPAAGEDSAIGTLELEDKSILRFDYSSSAPHNGTYSVADSLILGGAVTVRAVYGPTTSVNTGTRPVETPLLTGPAGTRIDASRFIFDPNTNYLKVASNGNAYPQAMSFRTVTDGETDRDTLYAVVKPMLVKKGTWSFGATSGSYAYADVTLAEGLEITWAYDPADDSVEKQRTAFLDVDDELVVEDGVIVRLKYRPVASSGGNETTNVVLRGPVGTRIDPAKFTFVPDGQYEAASPDTYPQRAHLVVTTDAEGRDSLCAVVEPMVVSVAGDPSSETEPPQNVAATVFEDGSKWSDGRVPHGDAHYVLRHCGNFPVHSPSYVFPGKTLFHVNDYTVQRISCDLTISNLVRTAGNSHSMGIGGSTIDLRGGLTLKNNLNVTTYASDRLNIHSDIDGGYDIRMTPFWSTAWAGYVGLYGDNSRWTGKLAINLYAGVGKTDYGPGRCCNILVRDGRALGGALPELAYDAVYLNQRATLHAETNLTLSADVNRGIWVTNVAAIAVAEACEMKVYWPVTLEGKLIKTGAGTLSLGGAMKFVDGAGNVTDEPPADETRRVISLEDGAIKPLSATSLDGATIVASAGTKLVFALNPVDEELKAYGIRNVKTKTPFARAGGNSAKIPIEIEGLADDALASLADGNGLGLVTVDSSVAKDVAAAVDFGPVRTEKHVGLVERDSSTIPGETTFRIRFKARGGMSVVIR